MYKVNEKTIKCLFVHAPNPLYARTQTYGAAFGPLWAYTLASYFPNDGSFSLELYDDRFDNKAKITNFDIIFYSGINQDCEILTELCTYFRSRFPDAIHFIGGPICMSFSLSGHLSQLDAFDHICIGDGEGMIQEIIQAIKESSTQDRIIRAKERFPVSKAKPFDERLLGETIARYYGGVVEVSRGCPFLCEFCDIRTLPDNNRPHIKSAELIVGELDTLCRNGVNNILMACDNFIGDLRAADKILDRIIEWKEKTGFEPGLYTWLTINLHKAPKLLRKMRLAGFDLLFIGIESFDSNSLLETAKVQNTTGSLVDAIREIQSYGFIVVAGLIQGFDSDGPDSFQTTLKGLESSALLSGDPSLLIALPGTPLYRRMKLSGRLRDENFGLGGFKYQSNIRYLMPKDKLIEGFKIFVNEFTKGDYQYRKLEAYFELLELGNFIPLSQKGSGFGSIKDYSKSLLRDPGALWLMVIRMSRIMLRPTTVYFGLKGLLLALRTSETIPGATNYFQFWFFAWTNAILKYSNIKDEDFDIESVEEGFDIRRILPENYGETADEPIPRNKINAQLRATQEQLKKVIERNLGNSVN